MYELNEKAISKIVKICAETFQEQSYYPTYEDYEEACKKKIAALFNAPVFTISVENMSKSFSNYA